MKSVHYLSMLDYCDGPLLFEARDAIGGHYLAMAVETSGGDGYAVVGVPPDRLREFRTGRLDLKVLVEDAGKEDWFLTHSADLSGPLMLERQRVPMADSGFLPDEGYVLHDVPSDETVLDEARARNNVTLELCLEPPEASTSHRIRVETLVSLLDQVQKIVKHAYKAALRDTPRNRRSLVASPEAPLLDVVVPAASGSFRVVLEAAAHPDLLGGSEVSRALSRMDTLFEHVADPDSALSVAKQNRGHLAGAYCRLLSFLADRHMGMRYSWADPGFAHSVNRAVTEAEAAHLADVLSEISDLGTEEVTIAGEFVKVNRNTGAWGLNTESGLVSGKLGNDDLSLNGLAVGGRYEFHCVEELETVQGTGKEIRSLYLREIEPV